MSKTLLGIRILWTRKSIRKARDCEKRSSSSIREQLNVSRCSGEV